jgi:hypothetical protein
MHFIYLVFLHANMPFLLYTHKKIKAEAEGKRSRLTREDESKSSRQDSEAHD